MSHPARAPLCGIDGKAHGACCRRDDIQRCDNVSEAATA
jgi:hypothetical protein